MRSIAILLPLALLASCKSFTWTGRGQGISENQRLSGVKDVEQLADAYETEHFWRSVRRKKDGRNNAFGRDLGRIEDFIDRHFFNYSKNDPYVNFPSRKTWLDHTGEFFISNAAGRTPLIEDTWKK